MMIMMDVDKFHKVSLLILVSNVNNSALTIFQLLLNFHSHSHVPHINLRSDKIKSTGTEKKSEIIVYKILFRVKRAILTSMTIKDTFFHSKSFTRMSALIPLSQS